MIIGIISAISVLGLVLCTGLFLKIRAVTNATKLKQHRSKEEGLADLLNYAAVIDDGEPCDWVEGAESLAELVSLIESGDYEALLAEDADNANEHAQEGGCACGCAHG